ATRATAWVAVSEERTVDPTSPIRRDRIPQALPYGMSVEALGLRPVRVPSFGILPQGVAESWALKSLALRQSRVHEDIPPEIEERLRKLVAIPARRVLPARPPVLSARLILRKGLELVVEIPVIEMLDWYARNVTVIWPDGGKIAATISDGTTRPGRVEAGQVIRLVLLL